MDSRHILDTDWSEHLVQFVSGTPCVVERMNEFDIIRSRFVIKDEDYENMTVEELLERYVNRALKAIGDELGPNPIVTRPDRDDIPGRLVSVTDVTGRVPVRIAARYSIDLGGTEIEFSTWASKMRHVQFPTDCPTINLPKYIAKVKMTSDTWFSQTYKPNWWFRLWQRLFLGWTWEDINEDS